MMRGLNRKIDIERNTPTRDSFGESVDSWSKIATRRSAVYRPLSAGERFTAVQYIASQQVEFRIRWSENLADVNPLDRVIYPASGGSPADSDIYDIIEVSELGVREALRIIGVRRAEIAV